VAAIIRFYGSQKTYRFLVEYPDSVIGPFITLTGERDEILCDQISFRCGVRNYWRVCESGIRPGNSPQIAGEGSDNHPIL
jgi:hypothetical protein